MKYKIITLITVICLLITGIYATYLKSPQKEKRIHQHLTSLKEETSSIKEYQTHLPIVQIDTDNQTIINDQHSNAYTQSYISIIDNKHKMNTLNDQPKIETYSHIKVRGNSSRRFAKSSYALSFVDKDDQNQSLEVMGMPKDHEWILNGPFLDKTLMRNYLIMNVAGEIMDYAPRVRYCEVFLNQRYQGLYLMMEPVSQGKDRVDIQKTSQDNPYTSYIIRADRGLVGTTDKLNNFAKYTDKMGKDTDTHEYFMDVIYPGAKHITSEKKEYIEMNFSQFEKALYSFDYDTKDYGYSHYIDVSSFIDYYIINEFFQNYDATMFSTYFYRDDRGKIHIGPVWDFNNAMDNYMEKEIKIDQTSLEKRVRYDMLFRDETFVNRVISRYQELRKTFLSEDYLLNYINDTKTYLGTAIERNYKVWGYSFDPDKVSDDEKLFPVERNVKTYDESIHQMQEFISNRGDWLDEHIDYLKQYAHESTNKKYNH